MIFADKLIALRKQHGLSQEQLAEKLNVSRQSVSKWEGAQSIPDINKIIQLSQIFGVSTDYLLKDELENEKDEYIETGEKSEELKYVSMEDANEFLNITQSIATYISIGVLICILAPIPLIVFAVLSEAGTLSFSEEQTAMVGVSVLLAMIAVAVALFIISGMKANKYEYLDTELIDTEYGVTGMVGEKKEKYYRMHTMYMVLGITLCVVSAIPIFFVVGFVGEENPFVVLGVPITLVLVALGVRIIVKTSIIWGGFQKILEEGDYEKQKKFLNKKNSRLVSIYWTVVVGIYLAYSFITGDWGRSWIIWPVAGVLSGIINKLNL